MRYTIPFSILAAGLLLAGAGCGPSDSPVSLDKYQVPDQQPAKTLSAPVETTAPATPEANATATASQPTAPAATSSNPTSPTTTSVTTPPEPLAFPGILPAKETANKQIRLKTSKGEIVFELLPKEGPNAASNFVYLVKRKFYDGLIFHRVVPGFVIQGGDPQGTGMGGPGYKFADDKVNLPYNAGIVAMANAGPDTNGSQYFIMLADNPLPPSDSIFGRVTKGLDVVRKIAVGDVMTSVTIEALK